MARILEKHRLSLGYIPLTDCAPLVVALEKGFFAERDLEVHLARERSWATIRDKVAVGILDGAQMPAGMPVAASVGYGAPSTPMVTALTLDLNGNAITVSRALFRRMQHTDPEAAAHPLGAARALARTIVHDRNRGWPPLNLATVYPISSHHYLLRDWLISGGIDPDRDVRLMVIPPAQAVRYLQTARIDGFCVGEPWNSLAVAKGLGRVLITSYEIWNNHPEKVFGVTAAWARRYPNTHQAVLEALLAACRWLDHPEHRMEAVGLLAENGYVEAPLGTIAMSMTGTFQYAPGEPPRSMPDFNVFHRYAANFPWRSHALIWLAQMQRWHQLSRQPDPRTIAMQVYRPDLYRRAAEALDVAYPTIDYKAEGVHTEPWTLTEASQAIAMGPDRVLAGLRFTGDAAGRSKPLVLAESTF